MKNFTRIATGEMGIPYNSIHLSNGFLSSLLNGTVLVPLTRCVLRQDNP